MKKIISLLISTVMILSSFASVSVMADTNSENYSPFYSKSEDIWNISFDNGEYFKLAANVQDWLRNSAGSIINGVKAGSIELTSDLRFDIANGGTHEIAAFPADSTNKVLKLAVDGTAGGTSKIGEWQSKITNGVVYDYDFYVETLPEELIIGYVFRNNDANIHDESLGIMESEDNTKLTVYTRNAGVENVKERDIAKDSWHNIKIFMKYDSSTRLYTQYSYVDNVLLSKYEKTEVENTDMRIDKVGVWLSGSKVGCVYIDNMKTYTTADAAAPTLTLTSSLGESFADNYEGTKFNLTSALSVNVDNPVLSSEILSSDDGMNYSKLSSSNDITLTAATKYYKAKYTFGDGRVLESNILKLYGVPTENKEIWNVDFNEEYTVPGKWGGNLQKNGVEAKTSDGSVFTTARGDSTNIVKIDNTDKIKSDGIDHGNALVLNSNSLNNDQCQINDLQIKKDIDYKMVISYDIAVTSAANIIPIKMEGYTQNNMQGTTSWFGGNALSDGKFVFHGVNTGKTMNAGEWYNIKIEINTVEREMKYYLNNELLVTKTGNDCPLGVKKIGISANSKLTDVYVDNVKVYNIEPKTTTLGFKNVNYKINDTAATAISAGTLTADIRVNSESGKEQSATCIFALYNGDGTLKSVTSEPISFDLKETERILHKSFGEVDANARVKIMLWETIDNLKPIDKPSELKPQ